MVYVLLFLKIVLGCTQIHVYHMYKSSESRVWVDIIKTRCARQITIFRSKNACAGWRCSKTASASPISNRCTEEIFNQLGWVFSPILFALFIAILHRMYISMYACCSKNNVCHDVWYVHICVKWWKKKKGREMPICCCPFFILF